MIVNIISHLSVFERAWKEQVHSKNPTMTNRNVSTIESAEIWRREFGITMIPNQSGRFTDAQFESDADFTNFLLRWS